MDDSYKVRLLNASLLREKMLSVVGMMLTMTSLGFGGFLLFYGNYNSLTIFSSYILVPFVTGVVLVLAGELFVNKRSQIIRTSDSRLERGIDKLSAEFSMFKEQVVDKLNKADENITNITDNSVASLNLSSDEKEALFDKLSKDVRQIVTKTIIEEAGAKQKDKIQHEDVLNFATEFRKRLIDESERLSSRANTNLFIGSITSIVGIAFLGFILIGTTNAVKLSDHGLPIQLAEYGLYYIPRLALIIFIEIFSYFFLKLYKTTLQDIKYYQNELTNIDSNISALSLSLLLNDSECIKKVSAKLLSTERNFVLKKGDTTVALEVARTEAQKSSEALKMFENLFKESKSLILPKITSNK